MSIDESGHDDEGGRPDWIDCLKLAAAFLTRLPVAAPPGYRLARASAAFPLIGAGVGLVAGLAFLVAWAIGLGAWLSAVVAVGVALAATGALHEDGLADTADGFGAGPEREARLAAMRDSGLGAFAVIALVLALTARIGALAALATPVAALTALVAAGAVSRAGVVAAMHVLPAARSDGLGASAGRPDREETLAALAVAAVVAVAMLLPFGWIPALVIGCGAAAAMAWAAKRAFGGQTGDVLGAIQQAGEIGVLAAAVAVA